LRRIQLLNYQTASLSGAVWLIFIECNGMMVLKIQGLLVFLIRCSNRIAQFSLNKTVSFSKYHKGRSVMEEETKIIELCKEDPRYFAPIYERYFEEIFRFIYRRTDDEEITADITSKVFLNCLKNLNQYSFKNVPFSAWLYKIAINEINQFFRSQKKRQRTVSLNDSHIDALTEEFHFSENEVPPHVQIGILLSNLTELEVQFIELRFFENYSFKEIGFFMNITEVNAKIKTYRILQKLKKISTKSSADNVEN